MKHTLFAFAFIAFALGYAREAHAQSLFEQWPALKEFHTVMSQTFHPMEEGNFEPIFQRAEEMSEKAAALAKSKIPKEHKKKEVIAAVKKLKKDSAALVKLVKAQSDSETIAKALTDLHDTFHIIVGLCSDEHDEHDEH